MKKVTGTLLSQMKIKPSINVQNVLIIFFIKELNRSLPLHYLTDKEIDDFCNKNSSDAKIRVIWIGHSTCLVNLENKIILMDPVFSMRSLKVCFYK